MPEMNLEQYKIAVDSYHKQHDKMFEINKFFVTLISSLLAAYLFILDKKLTGLQVINNNSLLFIFVLLLVGFIWITMLNSSYNNIKLYSPILREMEQTMSFQYMTKMLYISPETNQEYKFSFFYGHLLLPLLFVSIVALIFMWYSFGFLYNFLIYIFNTIVLMLSNVRIDSYLQKFVSIIPIISAIISALVGFLSTYLLSFVFNKKKYPILEDILKEYKNVREIKKCLKFYYIDNGTKELKSISLEKSNCNIKLSLDIDKDYKKSLTLEVSSKDKEKIIVINDFIETLKQLEPEESSFDIQADTDIYKLLVPNKILTQHSDKHGLKAELVFIKLPLIRSDFRIT